jgi:hypothetical protein
MSLPRRPRKIFSSLLRNAGMGVSSFQAALARIQHGAKLSNPKKPLNPATVRSECQSCRACKKRIGKNRRRKYARTTEAVRQISPEKGKAPSHSKKGEKDRTSEANIFVGTCRPGFRQELSERRALYECINESVHTIKGPSGPCSPKPSNAFRREP